MVSQVGFQNVDIEKVHTFGQNMSKSNSRNIFDFLFEGEGNDKSENINELGAAGVARAGLALNSMRGEKNEGDLEEAELSLDLSDDEREELADAEDVAAVDAALEDILGDLEVSMDAEEAPAEDAEEPEAEEDEGEEGDAGAEDEEELELPEADSMDA